MGTWNVHTGALCLLRFIAGAAALSYAHVVAGCGSTHTDAETCTPSCQIANAQADCGAECRIKACVQGYADCNADVEDGCETAILDNPAACGACDNQCGDAACAQGICGAASNVWVYEADVSDPFNDPMIERMAVDGSFIYWTSGRQNAGAIYRAPKAGGPATLLASATDPVRLAIDEEFVYWTSRVPDTGDETVSPALLSRIPKAGGTPQTLARFDQDQNPLDNLGVDADHVYVQGGMPDGTWAVARVPKTGGGLTPVYTIAENEAYYRFAVRDASLYLLLAERGARLISRVQMLPTTGGAVTTLADLVEAGPTSSLVVTADAVYFNGFHLAQLWQVALTELWVRPIQDAVPVFEFAVDDRFIYTTNDAKIWAFDRADSSQRVLGGRGAGYRFEGGLAVDEAFLYFATNLGITRIAKPSP